MGSITDQIVADDVEPYHEHFKVYGKMMMLFQSDAEASYPDSALIFNYLFLSLFSWSIDCREKIPIQKL